MDIIPDDSTEENRKRKIRRVLEQPHALLKLIRDNPVAQLVARNFPALVQPGSEAAKWMDAQIQTSIRYHHKQNKNPLMPPIRAPGALVTYKVWDHNSKFNAIIPAEFLP
eukprot:10250321-Karenia_brevis.AAC.1